MKFVLLAAGKGSRIYKKINKPKCLLQINGTSLIEKIIKDIKSISKEKIHIVVGFKSNLIKKNLKKYQRLHFIDNKDYKKKEMLHSLILALQGINDDIIFSYTDIIYNKTVIKNLLHQKKNIHLPILKNWKRVWKKRKKSFLVDGESLQINSKNFLTKIGGKIKKNSNIKYQYMGIFMIPKSEKKNLIRLYKSLNNSKLHITNFFNILLKEETKIKCIKYSGNWYEFDDWRDYKNYF